MDYLNFESFIHPDVLNAFLVKKSDVRLTVVNEANVNDEVITLKSLDGVSQGDAFFYEDVNYKIRAIDVSRSQIIINPLQSLIPVDTIITLVGVDYKSSLRSFYDIGIKDYNTFSKSLLDSNVAIRFDSDVYILKRAFIAMYTWILQNKAFLKDINLSGIGIKKSDIYNHFSDLLESERNELEAIRKEAMNEVARKQNAEYDGKSGKGFVRYRSPNRSYFSGYRR